MVIEPGIVGKIGFNSGSVGVCLNAIKARQVSASLLPIHVLLRLALECESFESAIARIESLGGAGSTQHILIADRYGSRGLELSPLGGVYLKPNAHGILAHTNHLLENKLVEELPYLSGSPARLERAYTLAVGVINEVGKTSLGEKVTPSLLRQRIFSDEANLPQAICCLVSTKGDSLLNVQTLFNIVMTFEDGKSPRAEVTFGRPINPGPVYYLPW